MPTKLVFIPESDYHSNRIGGLASQPEGKQAQKHFPPATLFDPGCHQKALPASRLGLTASDNLTRKTLTGVPSILGAS